MGSRDKGYKRDVQCREFFEAAGFAVEHSVSKRFGRTDWYNLVDFMAVRPDDMWFVQVKSNQTGGVLKEFARWADEHAPDWLNCAVAVCHDNEGWRLIDVRGHEKDPGGEKYPILVDERGNGRNMGEELAEYLARPAPRD